MLAQRETHLEFQFVNPPRCLAPNMASPIATRFAADMPLMKDMDYPLAQRLRALHQRSARHLRAPTHSWPRAIDRWEQTPRLACLAPPRATPTQPRAWRPRRYAVKVRDARPLQMRAAPPEFETACRAAVCAARRHLRRTTHIQKCPLKWLQKRCKAQSPRRAQSAASTLRFDRVQIHSHC